LKFLKYGLTKTNGFELTITILVGFSIGDWINNYVIKKFNFDSFLLSALIGISSLYLSFFVMGYIKKKNIF